MKEKEIKEMKYKYNLNKNYYVIYYMKDIYE